MLNQRTKSPRAHQASPNPSVTHRPQVFRASSVATAEPTIFLPAITTSKTSAQKGLLRLQIVLYSAVPCHLCRDLLIYVLKEIPVLYWDRGRDLASDCFLSLLNQSSVFYQFCPSLYPGLCKIILIFKLVFKTEGKLAL